MNFLQHFHIFQLANKFNGEIKNIEENNKIIQKLLTKLEKNNNRVNSKQNN